MHNRLIKRGMDFVVALLAMIILSPVLLTTAVLVKIHLGKPVLFKQERTGKNGEIFTIYKFKTMSDERDENGKLLPDDIRLKRFGRILRATSLDELPELFNILKGDMSIVGPRPLLVQYLPRYNKEQARRHDVKPGLTGWAQVNGRNAITWEEKFKLDVWYVDHMSLLLDLRILLKTIGVVFNRSGISEAGEATMSEFMGNAGEEK